MYCTLKLFFPKKYRFCLFFPHLLLFYPHFPEESLNDKKVANDPFLRLEYIVYREGQKIHCVSGRRKEGNFFTPHCTEYFPKESFFLP